MKVRKATKQDVNEVGKLYDEVCDYLENEKNGKNYPGWKKRIYPTVEDAEKGISEECLYVAEEDGKIAGTIILRHKPEVGYAKAVWGLEASYDEIYVVYTLAVHPNYLHKGVGAKLMQYAEEVAHREKMKAIRLDVVADNEPAIHLYESQGYSFIDTVDLGYGDFGLDWFRLYEKLL